MSGVQLYLNSQGRYLWSRFVRRERSFRERQTRSLLCPLRMLECCIRSLGRYLRRRLLGWSKSGTFNYNSTGALFLSNGDCYFGGSASASGVIGSPSSRH